jgi:hypothetical protein
LLRCTFFHLRLLRGGGLGRERHSVVYLRAIHAQRAVVVENQSIESQSAAGSQGLGIEKLDVAVDVDY